MRNLIGGVVVGSLLYSSCAMRYYTDKNAKNIEQLESRTISLETSVEQLLSEKGINDSPSAETSVSYQDYLRAQVTQMIDAIKRYTDTKQEYISPLLIPQGSQHDRSTQRTD